MSSTMAGRVWFHKQLGRMETEKLLTDSKEDGSFLIRESDSVRGAYVLSTIYQQRIHHYRIIPDDEGRLSIQAQQGVQRKEFTHLDGLVEYYSHARRGLVCALTIPIPQQEDEDEDEDDEEAADDVDDSDDDTTDGGSHEKNLISNFLLAFLSTVDTSKVDETFMEGVRSYLSKDVSSDIESMTTPTPRLSSLKHIFSKDCQVLHRHLNKMIVELELMKALFERAGGAKHGSGVVNPSKQKKKSIASDMDYDSLAFKLTDCADAIYSLETTAFQMLRELSVSMKGGSSSSRSLQQVQQVSNGPSSGGGALVPRNEEFEDEITFDVKVDSGIASKRNVTIIVNLKECKFQFFKPGDTQRNSYEHHQLLQLVKSRSRDTRLSVIFEGQHRKEYTFNDMQSREHFCQLTQLVRNRKLAGEDTDIINVFVGTWNMGDAGPPMDISSWILSLGLGNTLPAALSQAHDLYAFGTQETAIAEKEWTAKIRQSLKFIFDIDYEKVVCQSLWGMRCLVVAKPEHMNKISHIQTSCVKTGIGNTLGNKGGVGISFFFGSMSLCFICSHLTSGNEKCSRRNQNYHDILKGMSSLKQKKLNQFDLTNQFTHLFFFGDLNYRVDLSATEIIKHAKSLDHFSIYQEDQLRKEREKKTVFVGFEEAPILFPPTYRFQRGSRTLDDYIWVKQKRSGIRLNVPSYCDRVLWRSYPGTNVVNTSYGCTTGDITTSDHSPVFATFQMRGFKQYVSDSGMENKNQNAHIVVKQCSARIATNSKTNFYMEFYSPCFEGTVKTVSNNDWKQLSDSETYACPVWNSRDSLANIKPIFTEEAYLEEQHLLVMLKSQEGDEPYAECCISLRDVIGKDPVSVNKEVIHQGHSVGEIDISLHITLDTYRVRNEEDLYSNLFITNEDPISLDKPGVNRRPRNSDLDNHKGGGAKRDPMAARPMLPIPRTGSQSGPDRHRANHPGLSAPLSTSLPPPLPTRRRDMGSSSQPPPPISQRPPIATPPITTPPPSSWPTTMESQPPALHVRRMDSSNRAQYRPDLPTKTDNTVDSSRSRMPANLPSAPIPAKRKSNRQPSAASTPGDQPSTPVSAHMPTPRSRQTSDSFSPFPGPPVPKRQGGAARSTRPPSTVESLLLSHGLQHFSERLLSNGYDDLHFLSEVPDSELQEIGITQAADREKLLRVFKNYAQNH